MQQKRGDIEMMNLRVNRVEVRIERLRTSLFPLNLKNSKDEKAVKHQ